MLAKEFKEYLEDHNVDYELIPHLTTYTASETAQAAHVSGKNMAKVVVVKIDGRFAISVLPAHRRLDLKRLQESTGAKNVEIAHEYEFGEKFRDCELGAMPPFGELYDMDVYLADSLAKRSWLAFNCGSHSELLKMRLNDFKELVHPKELRTS